MTSAHRRRVLLALGATPIATLANGIRPLTIPPMKVGEAMRYVCDEVFPSVNQRLDPQQKSSPSRFA